jgi:hypothetical protein
VRNADRAREREDRRGSRDGWIAAVEELTAVLTDAERRRYADRVTW